MKLPFRTSVLPSLAVALAALAAPAHAALGGGSAPVTCSDSINTIANATYAGQCQGPLAGSFGAVTNNVATFSGNSFVYVGATGDLSGVFSTDPGAVKWGTLQLSAPVTGPFVLGLQGAQTYSLYLFNSGNAATSAFDFDTFGLSTASGAVAADVLQSALFLPSAVPEPSSYGMMLAGLMAVGFTTLRRRGAASRR